MGPFPIVNRDLEKKLAHIQVFDGESVPSNISQVKLYISSERFYFSFRTSLSDTIRLFCSDSCETLYEQASPG